MRNLRGTYVHRGDAARRRRRIHQILVLVGFVAAIGFAKYGRVADTANAEPASPAQSPFFLSRGEAKRLHSELENAKGELDLMRGQLDRANQILYFATHYDISASMATSIFDASLKEGVDPELGFRLVRLESEFNPRAVSRVGAVGLMQLMPSTARQLEKGLTKDHLFDRSTNLRVGFRYLRTLLDMFNGDVRLALLAYNRGEDAVIKDVKAGVDPGNGYDRWVARGYTGKGIISNH